MHCCCYKPLLLLGPCRLHSRWKRGELQATSSDRVEARLHISGAFPIDVYVHSGGEDVDGGESVHVGQFAYYTEPCATGSDRFDECHHGSLSCTPTFVYVSRYSL